MTKHEHTWEPINVKGLRRDERIEVSKSGELRKWNDKVKLFEPVKMSEVTGYPTFYVKLNNGKRAIKYLHRIVAETFLEKESSNQLIVIHLDYNKQNNAVDNLKWADRNEQIIHQQNNPNVVHKGRKHGYKINPADVKEIFKLVEQEGKSKAEVARTYGVSPTQIRRILTRKNWNDVDLDET